MAISAGQSASRSVAARAHPGMHPLSFEAPQIGRLGRVSGTREMVISGTCYIVPYQIVGNTLQILRVYQTARQWPETFE